MPGLKALLWDVDGTLAETERDGHRVAFNQAFAAAGLAWQWDELRYGQLLEVPGGRERLLHFMVGRDDVPQQPAGRDALARRLHALKNERYDELVASGTIALRAGVRELMQECRESGVAMAIATTTSRRNVVALLQSQLGTGWPGWFRAIVCGEDVALKKPHPQVYLRALALLQVPARESLAVEDSPAGVAAARAAGIAVLVTRSAYFAGAKFTGATAAGPGLHQAAGWLPALPAPGTGVGRVSLAALARWHASPPNRAGHSAAAPKPD